MRPEYWPRNIRRTAEKLKGVKLLCKDFERVIDEQPDGAFLFVDPPYFNRDQDKFYTHTFTLQDHLRLERTLHRNRRRLLFLLTYDNTDEVRQLYRWATGIHDKEWNYCINRTDDQKNHVQRKGSRYKGREIFILNYTNGVKESLLLGSELDDSGQLRLQIGQR
jgi:DNA adenine methylase